MKNLRKISMLFKASIGLLFILSSATSIVGASARSLQQTDSSQTTTGYPYQGHLRIYVTEPISRWNMYNKQPYHFGSLGLADDENLSIQYQDTFSKSIIWNGDVQENNVLVMAAVFNQKSHTAYAYPPNNNPFEAHYVDTAAAAAAGNTSYNTVNENFTHTVFIEEGTASWCQYCPAMASAFLGVYESKLYPFYYVSLIDDKSPDAPARLRTDYNIVGFPSAFFDGGYTVYVGGDSNQGQYKTRIKQCGQRDVHELNLTLSVDYIGNGDLKINVSIMNNELIPIIEIKNPTSGLTGIIVPVKNIDSADATNVEWSINVQGGVLKLLNVINNGTVTIPMGNQVDLKMTSSIFGLGKIQITVMVSEATKVFNGFIFGPFIIVK
jgi:hypothetical protein